MNTLNDKIKELLTTDSKFKEYAELLRMFIENPDTVTDKHPSYEIIAEVVPGLVGAYTRNQAIQIGIEKIVAAIQALLKEHELTYQHVVDPTNLPGAVLKTAIDGQKEYVDFSKLNSMTSAWSENELTERYFATKAENILSDKALEDTGSDVSVIDYLKKLICVSDNIENAEAIQYEDLITIFEEIRSEIKERVNDSSSLLNTAVIVPDEAILDYSDILETIRTRINRASPVEDKEAIVELVKELLEETEQAYTKALENTNAYLKVESKLDFKEDQILVGLKSIYDDLIIPLSTYKITVDEFVNKLSVLDNNLVTYSAFIKHTMYTLIGTVNTLRSDLMYVEYVYRLLVKLSEEGLLPKLAK